MIVKELDYAQIANSHTSNAYKRAKREHPTKFGFPDSIEENEIAVECERLYRVASLIAYGNNLAGMSDIKYFTQIIWSDSFDGTKQVEVKVLLPKVEHCGHLPTELVNVPKSYAGYRWLGLAENSSADDNYQVYVLVADGIEIDDSSIADDVVRSLVRLLGILLANRFARFRLFMFYDNKPVFDEAEYTWAAWHTLARLELKESPAICPVCGKVIDRRRKGTKGGQPPTACRNTSHIDDYNNEKKKLAKELNTIVKNKDVVEKAREMRWRGSNNKRPFRFRGINDAEEVLNSVGAVSFAEE